jgi:hypothetical protein
MQSVFKKLESFCGTFRGEGINHEKQSFHGELTLSRGITCFNLHFKATGLDSTVYHEEQTTIALNAQEKLSLWSVNTNNPCMLEHPLRSMGESDGSTWIVFGFGNVHDTHTFREEIKLELLADFKLGYHYAWGLPGGNFEQRSGLRMARKL